MSDGDAAPVEQGPADPQPVERLLADLREVVENARAMPMSASCVVHRGEVLAALDAIRDALPTQLDDAQDVVQHAESVLTDARRRGEELLAEARAEAERLVSQQAVVAAAASRAARLVQDAQTEAARLQREADDYCDRRLADFEIDLERIGQQVRRGREKLAERVGEPEAFGARGDAGLP